MQKAWTNDAWADYLYLYSSGALLFGFALDVVFGDPHGFPHIANGMGKLIGALDKRLRRTVPGGALLCCIVVLICTGVPLAMLLICYSFSPIAGFILESFLCWQLLAARQLKIESMKVYDSLVKNDIEDARKNVSMIVGRDTATLDSGGVSRATIESIAESASDGVAAPLFYVMLGGAALGCLYKAVNTMDSIIGYKNEKYIDIGRAAAKLDDALNYIPSRLCALLMISAAFLLRLDGKGAYRIWRRDRRNHASPNSAQTEAVCAGALGIRLAGPISYFGKMLDKPYIGDDKRGVLPDDIIETNRLMYCTSVLALLFSVFFRLGVSLLVAI